VAVGHHLRFILSTKPSIWYVVNIRVQPHIINSSISYREHPSKFFVIAPGPKTNFKLENSLSCIPLENNHQHLWFMNLKNFCVQLLIVDYNFVILIPAQNCIYYVILILSLRLGTGRMCICVPAYLRICLSAYEKEQFSPTHQ
jgi:hypothetical protein